MRYQTQKRDRAPRWRWIVDGFFKRQQRFKGCQLTSQPAFEYAASAFMLIYRCCIFMFFFFCNSAECPPEMDQTHQGSAAFWAETHRSWHREKEVQTTSLFSLLPSHGIRRRPRATSVRRAPRSTLTGAGRRTRTY